MVESTKSNVNVFIRLRPVPRRSKKVAIDHEDGTITFHLPREESAGYVHYHELPQPDILQVHVIVIHVFKYAALSTTSAKSTTLCSMEY